MDTGLLLLRVLLAAILFVHATQKLFGWFRGPGRHAAASSFEMLGHRPGRSMVIIAGCTELLGAALLSFGLASPLGATTAAAVMLVAGLSVSLVAGTPWIAAGGGEYPLVLAAVAVVLGFTGPGSWSLDALLDAPWQDPGPGAAAAIGIAAALAAAVAAAPPVIRARITLSRAGGR